MVSMPSQKIIATLYIGALVIILGAALAARYAIDGTISSELVTLLATLSGVLLGVPITNGVIRRINGVVNHGTGSDRQGNSD